MIGSRPSFAYSLAPNKSGVRSMAARTKPPPPAPEANGKKAAQQPPPPADGKRVVDFVCEDDVRRAIQKGEKIYTNARTIITPAARDMGEAAEVFAKA